MDRIHRPAPITSQPAPGQYYGNPPAPWIQGLRNYFADALARTDDPASQVRQQVQAAGSTPADRRIAAGNYGTMDADGEFADPAATMPRSAPMLPDPNAMTATGPAMTPPAPMLGDVSVPRKPVVDLNAIPPIVGPQGEKFAMDLSVPKAAPMMSEQANGGALSAAGGHDQVSGGAVNMTPPGGTPAQAPVAKPGDDKPDRMAALRFLMEAGLGTMAAGGQPGTNTLGAIGQGVLGAIDRKDARAVQKRQEAKSLRAEERENKRLGLEGRRVDLTEKNLQGDEKFRDRQQTETERHNKAIEEINKAKASVADRKAVRDLMKSGIERDQAILNLAQDKAKSDATSYVKDKWGLDTGTPSIDPQGYQKNVRKYLEEANRQFGTKITLPAPTASGTKDDPIEPSSQEEIDNAPPGTVFRVNGKLMVK